VLYIPDVNVTCDMRRQHQQGGGGAVLRDWLDSGFVSNVNKLMAWLINGLIVRVEDDCDEAEMHATSTMLSSSRRGSAVPASSTSSGLAPPWVRLVFGDNTSKNNRGDEASKNNSGDVDFRRRDVAIGVNEASVQTGQPDTTQSVAWVPQFRTVALSMDNQQSMFADIIDMANSVTVTKDCDAQSRAEGKLDMFRCLCGRSCIGLKG
jgi:hypothetical protein